MTAHRTRHDHESWLLSAAVRAGRRGVHPRPCCARLRVHPRPGTARSRVHPWPGCAGLGVHPRSGRAGLSGGPCATWRSRVTGQRSRHGAETCQEQDWNDQPAR